jgi:hypothetical protein
MENLISQFNNSMVLDTNEFQVIETFMNKVQPLQQEILFRVLYANSSIYLVDLFEKENEIHIKVLGNQNRRGRESYTITFNSLVGNFKCTCKDFQFRCPNKGILCKHISFVVCKVLQIYDDVFFQTKKMTQTQVIYILKNIKERYIWENNNLSTKYLNSEFKKKSKTFDSEDNCPICLNSFGKECVLSCPSCFNYVHKDCMKVWLSQNHNCVYCRYNWRSFNLELE